MAFMLEENVKFELKISIVMPVYNTPIQFLQEAVDSILGQSFEEYEFIIIDDGSDGSVKDFLASLGDSRIRIIYNEANIGITKSLNIGFRNAKGKYIARMDADDISLPNRLKEQYIFMERHPDVIVCGAKTGPIDAKQRNQTGRVKTEDMEEYRVKMLFTNPGPFHPTAFFRHEILFQYNILYNEKLYFSQDYGMWEAISKFGKVCVFEDVLLLRRVHEGQISKAFRERQIQCDQMTQRKLLSELLGNISDKDMSMHYICSSGYYSDARISPAIAKWYDKLLEANEQRSIYDKQKLKQYIDRIKMRLIGQTFTASMPIAEKILLYFRYFPFTQALAIIANIAIKKTLRKINCPVFKD